MTLQEVPAELSGILQVPGIRVPFGNAAHQPERSEGAVAPAAEFTPYGAALFFGDRSNGPGPAALGSAVGVDKKTGLPAGRYCRAKSTTAF